MSNIRISNFLSPVIDEACEAIAAYLSRRSGWSVEFVRSASFQELRAGAVDLAFVCGLPYSLLRDSDPDGIEPLVVAWVDDPRLEHGPGYFADLIVRVDQAGHRLEDFAGASFAYNEEVSFSGYMAVEHGLSTLGLSLNFFGELVKSGSHQESLAKVIAGEVEITALDSHVLKATLGNDPSLSRSIKVITSFGPFPMPPLAGFGGMSRNQKAELRKALAEMHRDERMAEVLARVRIKKLSPIEDKAYDPIRTIRLNRKPSFGIRDFV